MQSTWSCVLNPGTISSLEAIPVMTFFQWIIPALWLLFAAYWGISALSAKRSLGTTAWWRQSLLRVGIVVLILIVFHFVGTERTLRSAQSYQNHSPILGAIGSALV